MHVDVEIRDTGGTQLAAAPRANQAWAPAALARPGEDAEARVQAIVAANLGK
jgi:hypothetical protein